jgi:hypothetical protein
LIRLKCTCRYRNRLLWVLSLQLIITIVLIKKELIAILIRLSNLRKTFWIRLRKRIRCWGKWNRCWIKLLVWRLMTLANRRNRKYTWLRRRWLLSITKKKRNLSKNMKGLFRFNRRIRSSTWIVKRDKIKKYWKEK